MIDDAMGMEDLEGGAAQQFSYDVAKGVRGSAAQAARGMGPRSPAAMTALTLEAMIDTIGDFFRKQVGVRGGSGGGGSSGSSSSSGGSGGRPASSTCLCCG